MSQTPEQRARMVIRERLSQTAWYSAALLADLLAVIERQRKIIQKLRKAKK